MNEAAGEIVPFLVRKVMRSSNVNVLLEWSKNDLVNISSDVTTNEFRTQDSTLSFWLIDSLDDLDKAALAISLGGQKIEDLKLIVIESAKLEDHFRLEKTPGVSLATHLLDMHRDVSGITHGSLNILLNVYKESVDNDRCYRYKTSNLKKIIKNALIADQIDIEQAEMTNARLASDLKKLLAS